MTARTQVQSMQVKNRRQQQNQNYIMKKTHKQTNQRGCQRAVSTPSRHPKIPWHLTEKSLMLVGRTLLPQEQRGNRPGRKNRIWSKNSKSHLTKFFRKTEKDSQGS
ncbi:mCG112836, isoform CRA_b [Mus musculus]|nr:mCG112836, isoform CRA_b [Mus musculus]